DQLRFSIDLFSSKKAESAQDVQVAMTSTILNKKCFIADILCMLELPRIVSGSLVLASPAFRTLFISVIKSFFLTRLSAWRLLSRTTLIRLQSFRCLLS